MVPGLNSQIYLKASKISWTLVLDIIFFLYISDHLLLQTHHMCIVEK